MVSAFLNTVKIPELRQRILFTLAVIVIVRLGAAITTPGVNQAVLQEWFRNVADAEIGRQRRRAVQSVQRRRAGELRDLLARHHALHQRIDHDAVADGGGSAAGKLAREDGGRQKIMQYTRYATIVLCIFQGYLLASFIPASGIVSHHVTRDHGYHAKLGIPLVADPGIDVSYLMTVLSPDGRDAVPDVAGRSDHRRGIGNGISLVITVGIVARLPAA